MSISELLGAMMQSGMAPSSNQRLQNALGGGSGGLLESLGGTLGDVLNQAGQAAGGKQNLAKVLGVSRYTIYSYLKEVRGN